MISGAIASPDPELLAELDRELLRFTELSPPKSRPRADGTGKITATILESAPIAYANIHPPVTDFGSRTSRPYFSTLLTERRSLHGRQYSVS
jgi:hypothetical protein